MFCDIKSYNTLSMLSFGTDTGPRLFFPLFYCPVVDTLFEVEPEICCSEVTSRYCCYGNHAAGSEPI